MEADGVTKKIIDPIEVTSTANTSDMQPSSCEIKDTGYMILYLTYTPAKVPKLMQRVIDKNCNTILL